MQLISALILGTASAVVAEQAIPKEAIGGISARQLFPGFGSALSHFEEKRAETCGAAQVACHTGCIPIGGRCCATSGWCKVGTRCDEAFGGCCPLGKICTSGPTGGCSAGSTVCQNKCMPNGAACCSDGTYCRAGTRCDENGGCITGSGSRDGGGGGGGGCPSTQDSCDGKCMPKGAVCCHNGKYCDAGETCLVAELKCRPGSSGGSGGDGGSRTTTTATAQASYTLTPDNGQLEGSQSQSIPGATQQATDNANNNVNANTQTGGAGGGSSPTRADATVTTTRAPAAAGTVAVPMLLGAAAIHMALPLVM